MKLIDDGQTDGTGSKGSVTLKRGAHYSGASVYEHDPGSCTQRLHKENKSKITVKAAQDSWGGRHTIRIGGRATLIAGSKQKEQILKKQFDSLVAPQPMYIKKKGGGMYCTVQWVRHRKTTQSVQE